MSATVFYEQANELATLTNTFSVAGVATDPTTIALTVTSPSGTATTYTHGAGQITKTATGVYTKDIACTETGVWMGLWVGTGAASDADAVTWTVSSSNLQKLYCTPAELKSRVGIDDSLDDAEVLGACTAVSRWIDKTCNRAFYRRTATRTFEPTNRYCLDIPDLISVTTFKSDVDGDGVYETTWATTDYQLCPTDAALEAEPEPYTEVKTIGQYTFHLPYGQMTRRNSIQIVGVWGWPSIPDDIKHAAAVMSGDFLKLGGMAFGLAGYGEYGPVRARANPVVMDLIGPYRRDRILVA